MGSAKTKLLEQNIPASYLLLERRVREIAVRCQQEDSSPVIKDAVFRYKYRFLLVQSMCIKYCCSDFILFCGKLVCACIMYCRRAATIFSKFSNDIIMIKNTLEPLTPLGPTKIVLYREGVLWSEVNYTLCGLYLGFSKCPL